MDVSGAGTANGTNIQTYESNGTKAQKFKLIKAEVNIGEKTLADGVYNIVPKVDNNKVIQIEGQSTANNQKIQTSRKLSVINKSQEFEVKYLDNGFYQIKAYRSGKPLEVENGSHTNGTKVQQNAENDSYIQQWIIKESEESGYYYIISRCNGLCLDVPGGNAKDGAELQMYEGNQTKAQRFKFEVPSNSTSSEKTIDDGYYIIRSKLNSNKVLDISAGSYNNNANLQVWENDDVQQQRFKVIYNSEQKYYEIQSANSGKYLDVCGNGKEDGTNVAQYQKNNTIAQRWVIQIADNDSYYIMALNSNLYMDVCLGQAYNGSNIQIYEGNESNAQKFYFEPTTSIKEGNYKITIKTDSNKCLDISDGSQNEFTNLQIWSKDNVNQQVYSIEAVDNQYYKIFARHSAQVLTVTNDNNVVQTGDADEDNKLWKIDIVENGYFKITSKANGLCLDLDGNRTSNGTNIQVFQGNETSAQMFRFETLIIKDGIDVSSYNGAINWNIVKRFGQIDYAIIRAGYRGYRNPVFVKDAYFDENIEGIKENKIDIGLYFYTQAINVQEAIEEANYVISLVRQYDIHLKYPIFIDTEKSTAPSDNPGRADNLDRNTRTAVCKAFCDTIRNNGYIPGIYASKYWFYYNLDISQLGNNDIWVAHYTGDPDNQTDYKYKYDMWQYTSSGYVPGVNTLVDMNICYKNY